MTSPDRTRIFEAIQKRDEPASLRQITKNARLRDADDVYRAAFERLVRIQPSAEVGTIAHDVWRTIYAFEELLSEERGKTIRLSRTRQKIRRDGEVKTVEDMTLKPSPSDGFRILNELGILELSFEALVIARASHFPSHVVDSAQVRLESYGMDIQKALDYWLGSAPHPN